jgi:hypothetical protein
MSTESARLYDALYGFRDYGAAVSYLQRVLDDAAPVSNSMRRTTLQPPRRARRAPWAE